MSEELALDQARGDGAAIDDLEGAATALALGVNGAGESVLAGARLASEQDGRRRRGDALEDAEDAPHAQARAHRDPEVVVRARRQHDVFRLDAEEQLHVAGADDRSRLDDGVAHLGRADEGAVRAPLVVHLDPRRTATQHEVPARHRGIVEDERVVLRLADRQLGVRGSGKAHHGPLLPAAEHRDDGAVGRDRRRRLADGGDIGSVDARRRGARTGTRKTRHRATR